MFYLSSTFSWELCSNYFSIDILKFLSSENEEIDILPYLKEHFWKTLFFERRIWLFSTYVHVKEHGCIHQIELLSMSQHQKHVNLGHNKILLKRGIRPILVKFYRTKWKKDGLNREIVYGCDLLPIFFKFYNTFQFI